MTFPILLSIIFGGYISIANWIWMYQGYRDRNKDVDPHPTPPFVGAFFLGLGLSSFEPTRPYALLSIVADWGTLGFIINIPRLISIFWKESRFYKPKQNPEQEENNNP